jgi:GT2 family glycosyltransferase
MPAISVVIATYQRHDSLILCLEALKHQTFRDFNVFVVDDGGEDDSRRVFLDSNLPGAYLWHPHNGFGLSRSRNDGAGASSSEVLHFVDSDIMLAPDSLAAAWELYQEKKDRAIGGYYKYLPGMAITPRDVWARWDDIWNMRLPLVPVLQVNTPIGMDVRDAWYGMTDPLHRIGEDVFTYEHKVLWSPYCLLGGNMVIPRAIFDGAGGFDENITTYGGEDAEMSLAIISRGYGISYSRRIAGAHLAHPKHEGSIIDDEGAKRRYIAAKYPFFLTPEGDPRNDVWGKEVKRD